jgi:L-amino acid N-acyltransferase YncA
LYQSKKEGNFPCFIGGFFATFIEIIFDMNIELNPASEKDIPMILEMMEDFYKNESIPYDEVKSRATLRDFIMRQNAGKMWLINRNDKVVGYCCMVFSYTLEYHGPDCFIDEIYIRPEFQNKGMGKKALSLLEQYAKDRGIRAMHLFVFDENKKAFDIYAKNGFTKRSGSLMVKMLT